MKKYFLLASLSLVAGLNLSSCTDANGDNLFNSNSVSDVKKSEHFMSINGEATYTILYKNYKSNASSSRNIVGIESVQWIRDSEAAVRLDYYSALPATEENLDNFISKNFISFEDENSIKDAGYEYMLILTEADLPDSFGIKNTFIVTLKMSDGSTVVDTSHQDMGFN